MQVFKDKKDLINVTILIFLILLIIGAIVSNNNLFGSIKDWMSQHIQFADYLRSLFYDTYNLLPNFAFNLGGGENIYNISYYGLYNPIILFSYLLPFIDMTVYIQVTAILCVIISTILLYFFIRKKHNYQVSLIASIIFLMAGFLIFHAHRHIMFINYFPFLLLAFYGIDNYFSKNKKILLIVSIFLMILTSYYFSVVGILSISLYGVYKYLEINKNIQIKEFFKEVLKYISIIIIPILMSMILLLPTMYAMMNGRSDTNTNFSILSLLIPNFSTQYLLYSHYSLGIGAIGILSIIYAYFSKKRENIVLAIILSILFIFPIFNYLFNGGMYLNGKAFIPLLPLIIILISDFLKNFQHKTNILAVFLLSLFLIIVNIFNYYNIKEYELLFFAVDMTLLILIFLVCYKFKIKFLLYSYLVIVSLIIVLGNNYSDQYVTTKQYEKFNYEQTFNNVRKTLKEDNNFYRMSDNKEKIDKANHIYNSEYYTGSIYSSLTNENYKNFYTNLIYNEFLYRNSFMLTNTDNIFYNFYMGNKYLFNLDNDIIGYQKIHDNVYQNNDVLPVGYATDKIMSLKEYKKLNKHEKIDAYMNYAIVDNDFDNVYDKKIKEGKLKYRVTNIEGLDIQKNNNEYKILAKNNNKIVIDFTEDMTDKIILIDFKMLYNNSCQQDDSYITINGITNKLTCKQWKYHNNNYEFEYAVSGNKLNIHFSKGEFKISNINISTYDYNDLKTIKQNITEFKIDREKTKGDYIYGTITNKEKGYLKLSIPYDDGFEIYVDGQKTKYQKVNLAFIGFPLDQGKHEIVIKYAAPLAKEGLIISIISLLSFIILIIYDKIKK